MECLTTVEAALVLHQVFGQRHAETNVLDSVSAPTRMNKAAASMRTAFIGICCASFSPIHTEGTLTIIIPSVVPKMTRPKLIETRRQRDGRKLRLVAHLREEKSHECSDERARLVQPRRPLE